MSKSLHRDTATKIWSSSSTDPFSNSNLTDMQIRLVPDRPCCFSVSTQIKLQEGENEDWGRLLLQFEDHPIELCAICILYCFRTKGEIQTNRLRVWAKRTSICAIFIKFSCNSCGSHHIVYHTLNVAHKADRSKSWFPNGENSSDLSVFANRHCVAKMYF